MRSQGIDISGWQTKVDFQKVREAGIDFGYVKYSDGRTGKNKLFDSQIKGFIDADIYAGAYHYAQLDRSPGETIEFDARQEAKRLCEAYLSPLRGRPLPPVLDLEDLDGHTLTPNEVVDWTVHFADEVMKNVNVYNVILYTGYGFISRYQKAFDARKTELAGLDIWQAAYPRITTHPVELDGKAPKPLSPWNAWKIWQYAGDPNANPLAVCPGVTGACDRNVFNGTREDLEKYIGFTKQT